MTLHSDWLGLLSLGDEASWYTLTVTHPATNTLTHTHSGEDAWEKPLQWWCWHQHSILLQRTTLMLGCVPELVCVKMRMCVKMCMCVCVFGQPIVLPCTVSREALVPLWWNGTCWQSNHWTLNGYLIGLHNDFIILYPSPVYPHGTLPV